MDVDIGWNSLKKKLALFFCKHKISQLQKIKQLKRNMVCKYKFVLMNNEYNLYFNFFLQKNTLWFYFVWTWLEQEIFLTLVGRWIEQSSQQIFSLEFVRDLLSFKFFKPFECFSSSSKTLETEFLQSLGLLKTWSSKWERMSSIYSDFRG